MKKAFTLAEVLITLAIIGVVAALTIPSIVQNYQKTQVVTQLKKTYSALANTTNLAIAEYGPITGWEVGENGPGQAGVDFANKYLIPYLKVLKNCENITTGDCRFDWNYLNKETSGYLDSNYSRFYLNDGTLIGVIAYNGAARYAVIYIDVNGPKKPNTYGKDIFIFNYWIYYYSATSEHNGKFVSWGYNVIDRNELLSDGNTNYCNKSRRGFYCSAVIMKDSWQIKDDYPW